MTSKENIDHTKIKPEPQEIRMPLATSSSLNSLSTSTNFFVKPEPTDATTIYNTALRNNLIDPTVKSERTNDIRMDDVSIPNQAPPPAVPQAPTQQYTVYTSANDIFYEPELALKEGLGMVKTIRTSMQNLKVGSKLRQEVWLRELKSLEEETTPKTLIAVCGATGAGKSSLLNAVLDDNIVPTSGMRACTAVVTEIGYHDKNTIDADVSFLTEAEWRAELAVLLHDLVDEDGSLKRTTDLKSDAGVAWHKVSAVYPTLSQQKLVTMSVDQIIAYDRRVSQILGTTKVIVARNSKVFGAEIAKYIDSKEARGKKKDKKKEQEKVDGKSLMDKVREAAGNSRKKERTDVNGPAFWPLVRQVNVRCKAACLSTGAILVDLPGVADANAARAGIAKNYMKKCQCIWVLAPITRAVDDKTARDLLGEAFKLQLMMDGNYDDHTITFIASKCDDISCSEVISALNLDDETELQDIEDEIERNEEETKERKEEKSNAVKLIKAIDLELKNLRPLLAEHQNHLEAIKQGIPFTPTLTASGKKNKSKNKKRKNNRSDKERSPKRRRSDDQDEFIISDDDDEGNDTDISSTHSDEDDSASDSDKSDTDGGSDDESEKSEKSGDEEDDDEDEEEVVTEDFLKAKIDSAKEAIKEARARLNEARGQKKSANDRLDILKKEFGRIQRRKNAFCSLKRSEFSKEVLKEDFRTGLKDLDDAAAEERDPNNFDPTQNLRNYDAVNLPVFTCSSRDYVRLTGQVKGDGEPTCFTDKESTSIPALQSWCHTLTLSSRTRSSNMFYSHLRAFANSIKTYVHGIGDITAIDREYLREKWESNITQGDGSLTGDDDDFDYARWGPIDFMDNPLAMSIGMDHLYAMPEPNPPQPKRNEHGQLAGVAPRLAREFSVVIDKSVKDLQAKFQDGLEDRCRVGAGQAAESALAISDEFAASMHWASYRATLRRHGSFRRDLNVELLAPFTRNIATTWGAIFEQDLFAPFGVDALAVINQLLEDVEASAALGLKDRVKTQGELCREEAKVAMQKSIEVVRNTLNSEQKEISRCLAPHVQSNLLDGYDLAMEERGTGSVARQKMVFHRYVAECKDDMFDDGADTLMDKLSDAAKAVGDVLDSNFGDLAKKIEVNLSVLWEPTQDDPRQVIARREMVDVVTSVLEQIDLWTQAAKDKREEVAAVQALLETDNDVDMN